VCSPMDTVVGMVESSASVQMVPGFAWLHLVPREHRITHVRVPIPRGHACLINMRIPGSHSLAISDFLGLKGAGEME
jgi:hypothetical protein